MFREEKAEQLQILSHTNLEALTTAGIPHHFNLHNATHRCLVDITCAERHPKLPLDKHIAFVFVLHPV